MRTIVWLVRAFLFFALFAFALNNQHEATIKWFFNHEWHAPMVFVVLAAFALGCVFGVFAMLPSWWRHRRVARKHQPLDEPTVTPSELGPLPAPAPPDAHPPRDGL